MTREFKPWEMDPPPSPVAVNIDGPPCKGCKLWDPIAIFNDRVYIGVRLCHSDEQYQDFSCYRAKEAIDTESRDETREIDPGVGLYDRWRAEKIAADERAIEDGRYLDEDQALEEEFTKDVESWRCPECGVPGGHRTGCSRGYVQ